MRDQALLCLIVTTLFLYSPGSAEEMPAMPEPQKEHEWLQQLVGEWESEVLVYMEPGQEPLQTKGTETVRSIGGFWTISESEGEMPGMEKKFHGVFTLGYDPDQQSYVGSWVDSVSNHMWVYENGSLDADGKTLTLKASGPCPMTPGETKTFKEVLEIQDKDHRTFSSHMKGEDGEWHKMMMVKYTRK